jgi:hypothetical protein
MQDSVSTTFAKRVFEKSYTLSTTNPDVLISNSSYKKAALNFSYTMLFLSGDNGLEESLLTEIQNEGFVLEKFLGAYIYLIKKGFPKNDDFPYKNFGEIMASAVNQLNSESKDGERVGELAEIIHILLLNPKLDLNHKFHLNENNKSIKEPNTAIKHLFIMWLKEESGNKKDKISDILAHIIAITPDLSSITPNAKPNFIYGCASLFTGYMVYECKNMTSSWLWRQLSPIFNIIIKAFSALAGYFATLYFIDYIKSCLPSDTRFTVHKDHLTGSFANINRVGIIPQGQGFFERLNDIVEYDTNTTLSYVDLYIKRRLILRKYSAIYKLIGSSTSLLERFQLNPLLHSLKELYKKLDISLADNKIFTKEGLAEAFANLSARTFNENNLTSLKHELAENEHKQEFLLKFYDMAEKGFINLDLSTMHIIAELVSYVIYKEVNVKKPQIAEPAEEKIDHIDNLNKKSAINEKEPNKEEANKVKSYRVKPENLTLRTFEYAFDTCLIAQNSECNVETISKLRSITDDHVDISELRGDKLIMYGTQHGDPKNPSKPNTCTTTKQATTTFDMLWEEKLLDFDNLYKSDPEIKIDKDVVHHHSAKEWVKANILPIYNKFLWLNDSLKSIGISLPKVFGPDINMKNQSYPVTTCFGTITFGMVSYSTLSSTPIIAFSVVALHLYPKVLGITKIVYNCCSDGYNRVSSVYTHFKNRSSDVEQESGRIS